MRAGWGGLLVAGLVAGAQIANAQPLGLDDIPKNIVGAWVAGSASCDAPSLVVTLVQPKSFLFKVKFPKPRELLLREGVPAPQVVGAPPAAAFETAPGAAQPDIWIEARMMDRNTLDLNFFEVDDPTTHYRRCSAEQIG